MIVTKKEPYAKQEIEKRRDNKEIIGALALDLKRVSLGLHRGSFKMAERFTEEALKRKEEVDLKNVKPYIKKLLDQMPGVLHQTDKQKKAEDTLMYSILFQNYTQKL